MSIRCHAVLRGVSYGISCLGACVLAGQARAGEPTMEGGVFTGTQVFTAEGSERVSVPDTSIAFGLRLSRVIVSALSLEAELGFVPTQAGGASGVLVLGCRGHANLRFLRQGPFDLVASVGGGATASSYTDPYTERQEVRIPLEGTDLDAIVDAGLAVKFNAISRLGLRADARVLVAPAGEDALATPRLEFLVGVYTRFGRSPEPPPPPIEPQLVDDDDDGVIVWDDQCPREKEDRDDFKDDDGCPEADNDEDTIADGDDRCPNQAEDGNGIDEEDGCPEIDDDADGFLGSKDGCPDQAEDVDAFRDEDGCPEPDNDEDGFLDAADICQVEKEAVNGFQDDDGCPDEVPADLTQAMTALEKTTFRPKKARVERKTRKALDALAKAMKKASTVSLILTVRTDEAGDPADTELSTRRAEALVAYLVKKKIEKERLVVEAFGPPPAPEAAPEPPPDTKGKKGKKAPRKVPRNHIEVRLVGAPEEVPPSTETPPAETPPAETPPAETPPAETPPAP